MGTEQPTKVESEPPLASVAAPEKPVAGEDSKATAVEEKAVVPAPKKSSKTAHDRDVALAEVDKEKKLAMVKAWEDSEKEKAQNKAQKNLSAIASWENSKKADVEAKLKQIEEQMDKKKADYAEKIKNKMALIHKQAEEKRAIVEAQKGEEILKAEELAAKHRMTGTVPKKAIGCFGG